METEPKGLFLNEIEEDFVDFMVLETGHERPYVRDIFVQTKGKFSFQSPAYRKFCRDTYFLHKIKYNDINEEEIFKSYQMHEIMHIFRFLSYSYPSFRASRRDLFNFLVSLIAQKKWREIGRRFLVKLKIKTKSKLVPLEKKIADALGDKPVIIDYGCGLGYLSFKVAKLKPGSKVLLLDIDCLTLRFCAFHFKKQGILVETIPITASNLYPTLPNHDLCIATEVMEHLRQPLKAYASIHNSLTVGGVLYGDFSDHNPDMFHVSTDLRSLRQKITENFQEVFTNCYKKVK